MFRLIDTNRKRLLISRETIEEIKEHVLDSTREKDFEKALKSLNAVISQDVDLFTNHSGG